VGRREVGVRVPNELLREQIVIEDYAGSGARGPIYGERRTVRASVQPTQKEWIERDNTGQTIDIDVLVIVRPEVGAVRVGSRVVLRGLRYQVVRSYEMPDERRPSHVEIALSAYATADEGGAGSGSGDAP
jgi:hypothetical protein